jgi:hypothetical protein
MFAGLNTNVPYRGAVFHVQTETGGAKHPIITTLLYHQGAILYSKKTGYAEVLGEAGLAERLSEMMRAQHIAVIRDLEEGRLAGAEEAVGGAAPAEAGAAGAKAAADNGGKKAIDEMVMEYIFSEAGR